MGKIVICNMCKMTTEILTTEGGQKDVLLRRANIKKIGGILKTRRLQCGKIILSCSNWIF